MVVPLSSPSSSIRGNNSSNGSPAPAPAALEGPAAGAELTTSKDCLVGSGAEVPSTLSNSDKIVVSSWGFRSSRRSLMPWGSQKTRKECLGERTWASEQFHGNKGLGSACSDSCIRILQSCLQKFDEGAQREPSDAKLGQSLIHP